MRIESARALKTELLADMLPGSDTKLRGDVSIGIAPGPRSGEFKLAIRAHSSTTVDTELISEIRHRAAQEVEIRVVGSIRATDLIPTGSSAQTLRLGSSVAHFRGLAGSLGFFARRLADDAVGFVSCNHVLALEDEGLHGDAILHPAPFDGGRRPNDVVAHLDGRYVRLRRRGADIDCAFAQLSNAAEYEPSYVGPGELLRTGAATAIGSSRVSKVGRTTLRTEGRVTAFELENVDVHYSFGKIPLKGLMEIESIDERPFSRPGDSGSLVFTDERLPLGMICSASVIGGSVGSGLTYVNPIESVLQALAVEIIV